MRAAGVTACCLTGSLADLQLYFAGIHVRLGGWVAALRGLTRLRVAVLPPGSTRRRSDGPQGFPAHPAAPAAP
jgi:hypothetical protein